MRICWVVASLLILLVTSSDAQPAKVQALSGLTVYDANGKKVGPVIATVNGFPIVALKVNNLIALITVHPDHLEGSTIGVHFGQADCGGQVYLRRDLSPEQDFPTIPLTAMTPPAFLWIETSSTLEVATMRAFRAAFGNLGGDIGECVTTTVSQTLRRFWLVAARQAGRIGEQGAPVEPVQRGDGGRDMTLRPHRERRAG